MRLKTLNTLEGFTRADHLKYLPALDVCIRVSRWLKILESADSQIAFGDHLDSLSSQFTDLKSVISQCAILSKLVTTIP